MKEFKVGDWVCSTQFGWEKIIEIDNEREYSIRTESSDFTKDGRYFSENKFPSVFHNPPKEWNAGTPPFDPKFNDPVMVRSSGGKTWDKAHFVRTIGNKFCCFKYGRSSFTAKDLEEVAHNWDEIREPTDEELSGCDYLDRN
jgi:hypothetical protein